MSQKLLLSSDDVKELKALYDKALTDKDEEAIRSLAAEAVEAVMYRSIVAEVQEALALGPQEATDVLDLMMPLAEALQPIGVLEAKD